MVEFEFSKKNNYYLLIKIQSLFTCSLFLCSVSCCSCCLRSKSDAHRASCWEWSILSRSATINEGKVEYMPRIYNEESMVLDSKTKSWLFCAKLTYQSIFYWGKSFLWWRGVDSKRNLEARQHDWYFIWDYILNKAYQGIFRDDTQIK